MIRLSYTSTLSEEYNNYETIMLIQNKSSLYNNKNDISGELFWNIKSGKVVQILEGQIYKINDLQYKKIYSQFTAVKAMSHQTTHYIKLVTATQCNSNMKN